MISPEIGSGLDWRHLAVELGLALCLLLAIVAVAAVFHHRKSEIKNRK